MATNSSSSSAVNFVNERVLKLIIQSLTTNLIGLGRDDEILIRLLTSNSRERNVAIDSLYCSSNQQHQFLSDKLDSIGGSYGHFLSSLVQSSSSFYASLIRQCLTGISTNTDLLNEIFCLIPSNELAAASELFRGRYNENLRDVLQNKISGRNHLTLLTKLLLNGRNQNQQVNEAEAVEQAKQFNTILSNKTLLGGLSDESQTSLIELIISLSASQLQLVKKQFEVLFPTERSLEVVITNRVGGPLQQAILMLFSLPTEVYARKIKDACSGLATDEETISRIIGGRNAMEVDEICLVYQRYFNEDMRGLLKRKTSGKFRDALVSYLEFSSNFAAQNDNNIWNYLVDLDVFTLQHYPAEHPYNPTNLAEVFGNRTKKQLQAIDNAYRDANNRQTLNDYISTIRGKERRPTKRFYRYTIVDGGEVDVKTLRRALNPEEEGKGYDYEAIVDTLCSRSAVRLIDSRVLYEQLHDQEFLAKITVALENEPVLSFIILALLSHNRDCVIDRTDWDDGSVEHLIEEIQESLQEPNEANAKNIAHILFTHSLPQNREIAARFESTYNKNLEREICLKFSGLIGVAISSALLDSTAFLGRRIQSCVNNFDTINRLIGGTDKTNLVEMKRKFEEHFRVDLLAVIVIAYSDQPEYVNAVTSWITLPGFPE